MADTQHEPPHAHDADGDLLGRRYWESRWTSQARRRFRSLNYYHRSQAKFLESFVHPGSRFLELGCANSMWLAHMAKRGEVWGIDYSRVGMGAGETGSERIVVGDLFDASNTIPRGYFDVVFSEGLLEHFVDPEKTIRAFAAYLKPGGILLTSVPNMNGLIGRWHEVTAPQLFRAHVPHTPASLDEAHRIAGLAVIQSARYWGHFSIGVANYDRFLQRLPALPAGLVFRLGLVLQQAAAWALDLAHVHDGTLLSPHLRGAYLKP